ncbi:hypothetical protein H0N95_02445 [Candidatus Micrarchaeota archaeon]|nr:hypothetical protein [Candidatus Micrarchaeota archaeon]
MGEQQLDPKKRYNFVLQFPLEGLGSPGQRGFYSESSEKVEEAIKKGARIERVWEAEFNNPMITKELAAKNRKRFAKKMVRRR